MTPQKKMNHARKKHMIVRLIIASLFAIIAISFALVFYNLNQIQYVPEDVSSKNLVNDFGVINILITGSDSRQGEDDGNTDSMIVLSINTKTNQIVMTSIMRDLEVMIPGYGVAKINSANPKGGLSLLCQTIQDNFEIDINDYVAIDFFSFIEIVDALGGIDIEVDKDEINACNGLIREINVLSGSDPEDGYLSEYGLLHLNGKQALAYSRVRYVGNADYERTERQRIVLSAIIDKVATASLTDKIKLITAVLPAISTNLTQQDLWDLSGIMTDLDSYEIIENRIPIEGENVNITDFSEDIEVFQQLVYPENEDQSVQFD